jgi:CcmD family protein
MNRVRHVVVCAWVLGLTVLAFESGSAVEPGRPARRLAAATMLMQQPPAPRQQDEFVPIEELPPQDQLPAAPLLVAAYSCVVVGLFLYVISVARRLTVVQRELDRLASDLKRSGRV